MVTANIANALGVGPTACLFTISLQLLMEVTIVHEPPLLSEAAIVDYTSCQ
jgi:hypothetical protein